jgi:pimeloyl-ACP methyl ester carboxylesterase
VSRAGDWRARGDYFSWRPAGSDADEVQIFHVEAGVADAPTLLLVHGFPTSSIDWYEITDRLAERYRVCALDFPGYGFSDKPVGWGYSLTRDAELLGYYLSEVLSTDGAVVYAHDRGDSVALILAGGHVGEEHAARVEHLFLTNGNVFLPLSNLTIAQRVMLDAAMAPAMLGAATPDVLAQGMGATTFWPPRGPDDPAIEALAETFAHQDGLQVIHETIQYLRERADDEETWLQALGALTVPTILIWGLNDTVSPPRVATWVWNEHVMLKPGRNSLYFVSDAGHYLQNDRPDAVVDTILHALDATGNEAPGAIAAERGSPVLIDRSRERLPDAAELLAPPSQAELDQPQ